MIDFDQATPGPANPLDRIAEFLGAPDVLLDLAPPHGLQLLQFSLESLYRPDAGYQALANAIDSSPFTRESADG